MNTDGKVMGWIFDEYSKFAGFSPGMISGSIIIYRGHYVFQALHAKYLAASKIHTTFVSNLHCDRFMSLQGLSLGR